MDITDFSACRPPRAKALVPFAVFLIFYVGVSICAGSFYKVPMPIAFLVASAVALVLDRKSSLRSKIELFAHGMGNVDIMTMCLIFILAGAFAATAKAMGAVEAASAIALQFIPPNLILCGLFLVACFISISIGTSVGTIVALTPIAIDLTGNIGLSIGLCLGAVVGGAMFGDNLSMISDTTIAATRTQNVEMRSKFHSNIRIAIPAAFFTVLLYIFLSKGAYAPELKPLNWFSYVSVLPYLCVLVLALFGFNVMALLMFGTLFSGIIGILNGAFDFWGFLDVMGKGSLSMSETLIVALLAGGLLKVIRYNGGIEYILLQIEKHIHGCRGGELGISLLVMAVNVFTANNTVAIVIAGPIAKDISERYDIEPKRSASLLDTSSCIIQGILPYGAQVLAAVGLASKASIPVSSPDVLKFLCYPYVLAVFMLLSILFSAKRNKPAA